MTAEVILAVTGLILMGMSIRVVGEQERLAILRLGRFIGIRGPGLVWTLPFVDRATRVDLDRDIPNWRSLSGEQLSQEIGRRLTGPGLGG